MTQPPPVLSVSDLRVSFASDEGPVRAVDGVDFSVSRGETVALVGESGCGKTVSAMALARLVSGPGLRVSGGIELDGENVLEMNDRRLRAIRGAVISYVFQDPASSLNPVKTVGSQIGEAIRLHRRVKDVTAEVADLLRLAGLPEPESRAQSYPHQLSGGMQQRVMIAMALACRPKLLVADEPTTALDVTIQAKIFQLLRRLRSELDMAVLLITHNLGLVAANADRVYVMYAGRMMESGPADGVLRRAAHPYTRGLLAAVPRLRRKTAGRLTGIEGTVPHPARLPSGCRFHPRCSLAQSVCREIEPDLENVTEGHQVRCHFWKP